MKDQTSSYTSNLSKPILIAIRSGLRELGHGSRSDTDSRREDATISVRDIWMTYPGKRRGDPTHVLERDQSR